MPLHGSTTECLCASLALTSGIVNHCTSQADAAYADHQLMMIVAANRATATTVVVCDGLAALVVAACCSKLKETSLSN